MKLLPLKSTGRACLHTMRSVIVQSELCMDIRLEYCCNPENKNKTLPADAYGTVSEQRTPKVGSQNDTQENQLREAAYETDRPFEYPHYPITPSTKHGAHGEKSSQHKHHQTCEPCDDQRPATDAACSRCTILPPPRCALTTPRASKTLAPPL